MARTKMDATTPLYAMVGAGDLAVALARTAAADVQSRLAKIDLSQMDPRRVDLRRVDLRRATTDVQARLVKELQPELVLDQIDELAGRGKVLVDRIRRQQATRTAAQAGRTTVAKAKTTKTQTSKAASSSAATAKESAKKTASSARKTASTAKRGAKSTTTSARRTASAASKAATDAASKTGN